MSTRAVFTFYEMHQKKLSKISSFYIHSEGYPESCANYLKKRFR